MRLLRLLWVHVKGHWLMFLHGLNMQRAGYGATVLEVCSACGWRVEHDEDGRQAGSYECTGCGRKL